MTTVARSKHARHHTKRTTRRATYAGRCLETIRLWCVTCGELLHVEQGEIRRNQPYGETHSIDFPRPRRRSLPNRERLAQAGEVVITS